MTISYQDIAIEQASAADSTAYTIPSVNSAHIISAVVHNESASNATITANIVQSGGSVGVTNQYLNNTIPAETSVIMLELVNMVLKTGDFISFRAGTANALNVKLGIKEITS